MSRLGAALLALGESRLQQLVGASTTALLSRFGDRSVSPSQLALLLESRKGELLLREPTSRKDIILTLRRDEVVNLADNLGVIGGDDPWKALTDLRFSRHSVRFKQLLEFFEVTEIAKEHPKQASDPETEVRAVYPLFPYQQQAALSATAFLRSKRPRVLLHLPTGAGKTRTAMNVIAEMLRVAGENSLILWLAHSEELCDQAAEEFTRAWTSLGDRSVAVSRCYGEHNIDLGTVKPGLLVAGLAKLYSRSLRDQSDFLRLKENLTLVVMDEAHKAIASSYQHILDMLAPSGGLRPILGLSATPGRSWLDVGEDERLAEFFSRQKVSLQVPGYANPVEFLQATGYLAVPEYQYIRYNPKVAISASDLEALRAGFDLSPVVLSQLARDEGRNAMILDAIIREAKEGMKILIFGSSVENAELLTDVLTLQGYSCAAVSADTPADERASIIADFRSETEGSLQMIANYGVLTTGFDAPKTRVAVIARATQSVVLYSQMIGRVIRGPRLGGNPTCKVITVVDNLPGFRNIYEGFSHWEEVW